MLRAIDGLQGSLVVACALKLVPLLLVRLGERRHGGLDTALLRARKVVYEEAKK